MLREYLTNIANAIRAKLGTTNTINAQDFSTKVDEVYEQGRKDEYDEFWKNYMADVTLYNMSYAFSGQGWTVSLFRPNRNMSPTYAQYMFSLFNGALRGEPLDMVTRLNELGVSLTFEKCVNMQETFNGAYISRLGEVDIRKTNNSYGIFSSKYIVTIDNLVVSETVKYNNTFRVAEGLENLTITGTIGQNGFSVAQSTKLSPKSIKSIINALSTTTSGLTVTLSKTAVNNAFGINIDDPTTWAEGTEYYELRHSRDNWTITYV